MPRVHIMARVVIMRARLALVSLALVAHLPVAVWASSGGSGGGEPNPPIWPSTVKVFGPEDNMASIQSSVNAAYGVNGGPGNNGQFSQERFAFLFKPGHYNVEVPVGFYTQVAGLGASPADVVFTSPKGVYCQEGSFSVSPGALDTFWRSAENFQTDANFGWSNKPGMLWAVSQAAPLRRVVVTQNLNLYQYVPPYREAGYASGGFMANLIVKGEVIPGSQQQFMARNTDVGSWFNGVWNMVFVGVKGAPASNCGETGKSYTTVDKTPVIAEKPFISIEDDMYYLNVPTVQRNSVGANFDNFETPTQIDFSKVYVANAATDTADSINFKLSEGMHVVFSAGIYSLDSPLLVNRANQVLLGLGLATLLSANGNTVIKVGNVDGVRVAGLLLEAGHKDTPSLLEWGDGSYSGNEKNPGFLHDIFARVGGPKPHPSNRKAKVMLKINTGHVIGDNLWLWRADHSEEGLIKGTCPCENALIVNGDDVTFYGLAAEHTQKDLVVWNGERGSTYFYQSELPYDAHPSYGQLGYAGYRVTANVKQHLAYGIGVYHYFRDYHVTVKSGIVCPPHLEDSFTSPLSVFLNGWGTMLHILNDKGEATYRKRPGADAQWLCTLPGPTPAPTPGPTPAPTPRPTPAPTPAPTPSPGPMCKVGDPVHCPNSEVICAGDECCPDGSTCPSAAQSYDLCPNPKKEDCTRHQPTPPTPAPTPAPTPSPGLTCKVGDPVHCPNSDVICAGNQCCQDGSTCPSADPSYDMCPNPKKYDCLKHAGDLLVV